MRITIPYNEILPTGKAHDAFLFREAAELAKQGCSVDLLIGQGSLSDVKLLDYYGVEAPLIIHRLPIVRKNNPFNLSWNLPFFMATQAFIQRHRPDRVLLSVRKQAAYHAKRRIQGVKYIYEAHEVALYPGEQPSSLFVEEREMLCAMDLICTTTHALKNLLCEPPYSLSTPIVVVPLAVDASPLPPPKKLLPPTLTYVGQLYKEQGVEELMEVMKQLPQIHLRVIGGRPEEIAKLDPHLPHIHFEGFIPPSQVEAASCQSHAFIAPFHLVGKMPYVAHTKLYAYRAWGRPVIAPHSPIVHEHLPEALTYRNTLDLLRLIQKIPDLSPVKPVCAPWSERIHELKKNFA